jgi:hypothetical protein
MRRSFSIAMTVSLLAMLAACGDSGADVAPTTVSPTTRAAPTSTAALTTTVAPIATVASTATATFAPTTLIEEHAEPWTENDLVFFRRVSDGATLTLDMHFPAEPENAPIVVQGEEALADEGMIVVTIGDDDHLGGWPPPAENPFPVDDAHEEAVAYNDRGAPIRELADRFACAIRFARVRASELGNDDPTVVLTGFSGGAGIAVHVALFGDTYEARWDEFAAEGGPQSQFDCEVTGGSTHVDAVVGTAGGYNVWVPIYDDLYGPTYLNEHDPELQAFLASAIGANPDLKVRLLHGTSDDGIPFDNSVLFATELAGAGYDVGEVIPFSGGHRPEPLELYVATVKEVLDR